MPSYEQCALSGHEQTVRHNALAMISTPTPWAKPRSYFTGFTLLELLFVLAIVGILSTLAIPMYQHYTNKVTALRVKNALIEGVQAQSAYYNKHTTFTLDLEYELKFIPELPAGYSMEAQVCGGGIQFCVDLRAIPVDDENPIISINTLGQGKPQVLWKK